MNRSERVAASRRAQGLPSNVTDPAALARIAELLRGALKKEADRGAA